MAIYQNKNTKKWQFRVYYKDLQGNTKQKNSKFYDLKKEAQTAEIEFVNKIKNNDFTNNLTFKELWLSFLDFKKDKVKITSFESIKKKEKYYISLFNINVTEFNISHFNQWKLELNKKNLSTIYKNNIYKNLRAVLNYAIKYFNINTLNSVLHKMVNFTDPNELKEEMLFFTYEEFKEFIVQEKNLVYKTFFELLYFCGLRQGEALALTWNDINFDTGELTINKNLTTKIKGVKYKILTPKTKASHRKLIIKNETLLNDLKSMCNRSINIYNFSKEWFIFGNVNPLSTTTIQNHKNKNCKLAEVKQIRIHDFRHSCASLLINKGASITLIAKYLGHGDIATTLNTYSHMYKNELETIADSLKNL